MDNKIDNLVKYFNTFFDNINNDVKGTNFSRTLNKKTINLTEQDFKKEVAKLTINSKGVMWVNPIDILIMSIRSIERITDQINIKNCNRFTILWIMCLLNIKYMAAHDYHHELSLVFLSNLAGFQIEDYIFFEKYLLPKLDWRLEISNIDYKRLNNFSNGIECIC